MFYLLSVDKIRVVLKNVFINIRLIKINNKHILFWAGVRDRNDTYTYNSPAPVSRSENPGESG